MSYRVHTRNGIPARAGIPARDRYDVLTRDGAVDYVWRTLR